MSQEQCVYGKTRAWCLTNGPSCWQGHCPFSACDSMWFCGHERRCMICENWSCSECRFTQGDGTDVLGIVQEINPDIIFFDFDRTLCSTKSGNSPLVGNHNADEWLLEIARKHSNVHVVTRNSHVSAAYLFHAKCC